MSLAGLRRSAQKMGGNKGKSKGGYYANWTPPSFTKNERSITPQEVPHFAEPIVIIEGEYADPFNVSKVDGKPTIQEAYHYVFHRYMQKYNNKTQYRMMACLRGADQHNPKQCVPCLLIDNKELDEKGWGARSGYIFNIAHMVPYHQQPLVKNNQIQTRKDNGQPIMIDRECRFGTISQRVYARTNQKQCEGCQQQAPQKLGSHRYWQVGKNHLNDLLDFNKKILGKICFYTNTGIIHVGFGCAKCGTSFVNLAQSGMTNEQIDQFADNPVQCPNQACKFYSYPQPEYDSGYTEGGFSKIAGFTLPNGPDGKPVRPRPLSLFDVVLWVQREGESTDSAIVITRWCRLTKFPTQNGEVDVTQYVNEQIVPQPFDFDDIFSIDTDTQAKLLDRPNPYSPAAQQQNFARYGQLPVGGYAGPTIPQAGMPAGQFYPNQGFPAPQPNMTPPGAPNVGPGFPHGQPVVQQPQAPIAQPYPQPAQFPPALSPPQAQPAMPGMPQRPNWGGNGGNNNNGQGGGGDIPY